MDNIDTTNLEPLATGTPVAAPPATVSPAAASVPAPAAAAPPPAGPKRVQLTTEELNERLRRAKSSGLRDVFGTDDAAAIRARLTKAEEYEKQAEEQKRAQMTEMDRMKYDLNRARQEAVRYRSEVAQMHEREIIRDQQSVVERIATRHINPLYAEEASISFARDIASRDPKEVARMTDRDIAKWFQKYAERKPALAASAQTRRAAATAQRPAAGAQTPPPRPSNPASSSNNGGKTYKPGQPNSMSRAEARAEAKRNGYSW